MGEACQYLSPRPTRNEFLIFLEIKKLGTVPYPLSHRTPGPVKAAPDLSHGQLNLASRRKKAIASSPMSASLCQSFPSRFSGR